MLAARLQELAVHVNDPPRPCALMQVVDVLGDEGETAALRRERVFEPRQRPMRGVGLGVEEVAAPHVVEGEHVFGIAGEGFGGRELHRIEPRP